MPLEFECCSCLHIGSLFDCRFSDCCQAHGPRLYRHRQRNEGRNEQLWRRGQGAIRVLASMRVLLLAAPAVLRAPLNCFCSCLPNVHSIARSAFKSDEADGQVAAGGTSAKPGVKPKKRGSIFNVNPRQSHELHFRMPHVFAVGQEGRGRVMRIRTQVSATTMSVGIIVSGHNCNR